MTVDTQTATGQHRRPPPRPPRRPEDLPKVWVDHARRVASARVVFADYDLLRTDFPWLRTECLAARHPELDGLPQPARDARARALIDDWLLANGGLISVTQAAQSVVNTPIAAAGATVEVYRQARGGRVFTVPVRAEPSAPGQPADGLLDLKGIGLRPRDGLPPRDVHANGLLPLRHAFEELILTLLGDAVLRHAGADACVLPVYGVVDHGFDLLDPWDRSFPAGVLVRQGHRRKRGTMEFPPTGSAEHALQLRIERLLRRYGVTSVHPAGTVYEIRREDDGTVKMQLAGRDIPDFLQPQLRALWNALRTDGSAMLRFEGINIQFTQTQDPDPPQLVDFAQFRVASRFVNPLLTQVNDRPPFHWGGFLYPDSPQFVQPDPELALAAAPWEPAADLTSSQAAPIAQGLKLNRFEWLCARLAHEFRHGRISGFEVKDTLAGFVAGLTSHLG